MSAVSTCHPLIFSPTEHTITRSDHPQQKKTLEFIFSREEKLIKAIITSCPKSVSATQTKPRTNCSELHILTL